MLAAAVVTDEQRARYAWLPDFLAHVEAICRDPRYGHVTVLIKESVIVAIEGGFRRQWPPKKPLDNSIL